MGGVVRSSRAVFFHNGAAVRVPLGRHDPKVIELVELAACTGHEDVLAGPVCGRIGLGHQRIAAQRGILNDSEVQGLADGIAVCIVCISEGNGNGGRANCICGDFAVCIDRCNGAVSDREARRERSRLRAHIGQRIVDLRRFADLHSILRKGCRQLETVMLREGCGIGDRSSDGRYGGIPAGEGVIERGIRRLGRFAALIGRGLPCLIVLGCKGGTVIVVPSDRQLGNGGVNSIVGLVAKRLRRSRESGNHCAAVLGPTGEGEVLLLFFGLLGVRGRSNDCIAVGDLFRLKDVRAVHPRDGDLCGNGVGGVAGIGSSTQHCEFMGIVACISGESRSAAVVAQISCAAGFVQEGSCGFIIDPDIARSCRGRKRHGGAGTPADIQAVGHIVDVILAIRAGALQTEFRCVRFGRGNAHIGVAAASRANVGGVVQLQLDGAARADLACDRINCVQGIVSSGKGIAIPYFEQIGGSGIIGRISAGQPAHERICRGCCIHGTFQRNAVTDIIGTRRIMRRPVFGIGQGRCGLRRKLN